MYCVAAKEDFPGSRSSFGSHDYQVHSFLGCPVVDFMYERAKGGMDAQRVVWIRKFFLQTLP
jgi:hypothetical protein